MVRLLNINGFTGWRLPTREELNLMYVNLKLQGLGSFKDDFYWSSTVEQVVVTFAMYHHFGSGLVLGADQLGRRIISCNVRPVRQF